MTPATLLLLGAAALAAAELRCLEAARARTDKVWRRWHIARAMDYLSTLILGNGAHMRGWESIDQIVPAAAMCVDTVTALLTVSPSAQRSALRVAATPRRQSPSLRSAVALLAAHSLQSAEVPELDRAVSTRTLQRGENLTDLLRHGVSSLPPPTRERLLATLQPTPYIVAPVVRASEVVALLIATATNQDLALRQNLVRVAHRIALVSQVPVRRLAERRPPRSAKNRRTAARGAELVLWLDPHGLVAAAESLGENDWSIQPAPTTLGDLLSKGSSGVPALLSTARDRGEPTPVHATLRDGTEVELSLIPLSDVDDNLWGYAALLRRTNRAAINVPQARFAR